MGRVYALDAAEKYGASSRSILLELGYDDTEIDNMIKSGVVSEAWSNKYLPD